jgi:AcrR family transcriptional regulator
MIRDALTALMEEKGFEGITVRDLTTKADINRGTFYLHYRDKYDLLLQSEDEILQEIEEIVKIAHLSAMGNDPSHNPAPFIEKLFEYLQDNSTFMRVILGPKGDPAFQMKLKEVIKKKLLQVIDANKSEMLVPAEYLSAYVSSAHLGVIQYWLESGMKTSPQEMSLIILKTTFWGPGTVAGIANNFNFK